MKKEQPTPDDRHAELNKGKVVDRLMGFIMSYFLRLNIARKLMLGYSSLLALLVIISVYALMNLNRLNALNTSILQTDIPVINASEKMIDVVFAQERYARRYLILGTPDVLNLFSEKKKEFEALLDLIKSTPDGQQLPVDKIASLHQEYVDILLARSSPADISGGSLLKSLEDRIKAQQEKIIAVINKMASDALVAQNVKTSKTTTIGRIAFKASAVLCGLAFSCLWRPR